MAKPTLLMKPRKPWLLRTYNARHRLADSLAEGDADALHLVNLEGSVMSRRDAFYAEIVKKLRLPDYFGENLNALSECITDLEWADHRPVILVIHNAELLERFDRELFDGFVDVLEAAAEEWSEPITEGAAWDRPAVPFHTIFDYSDRETFEAARFEPLEWT